VVSERARLLNGPFIGRSYGTGIFSIALSSINRSPLCGSWGIKESSFLAMISSGLSELETASQLTLRNSPSETFFDNGLHGSLLMLRQLPYFLVKTIWYLYSRLHLATHIIGYAMILTYSKDHDLEKTAATDDCLRERLSLLAVIAFKKRINKIFDCYWSCSFIRQSDGHSRVR
jgi:hypothetical protein